MIAIKDLRTYWEAMPEKQPELKKVFLIIEESEVRDIVANIRQAEQPFAIVVVPSAKSSGSVQDNFSETNNHLFYVLRTNDSFSEPVIDIIENLQPLTEAIKEQLLTDKPGCGIMRTLDEGSFVTDPENKLWSKCTGWSVSFES